MADTVPDRDLTTRQQKALIALLNEESVRKAAKDFLALAGKAVPRMIKTANHPLPAPGRVRFYVLTPKGILTTETDREALGQESRNELSALFYSGQEVVAQMRQVQAQKT